VGLPERAGGLGEVQDASAEGASLGRRADGAKARRRGGRQPRLTSLSEIIDDRPPLVAYVAMVDRAKGMAMLRELDALPTVEARVG
jgi:hypothetical protein